MRILCAVLVSLALLGCKKEEGTDVKVGAGGVEVTGPAGTVKAGKDGVEVDGPAGHVAAGKRNPHAIMSGGLPAPSGRRAPGGGMPDQRCPLGNCKQACPPKETCVMTCTGGGCEQRCEAGAHCKISCTGGNCNQTCADAGCALVCPGGGCTQACAGCTKSCTGDGCK